MTREIFQHPLTAVCVLLETENRNFAVITAF